MKKVCLIFVQTLILFGACSISNGVCIDFDEWSVGHDYPMKELTTEYLDLGIVFEPGTTFVHLEGSPGQATSPHNLIKAWGSGKVILDASFVLPGQVNNPGYVPWVEFSQDWGAQSGGGYVDAYDINGIKVIDSAHFAGSGAIFRYEWEQGIHRIVVWNANDDIDDLCFGQVTPEPATILLLGLGGLALLKKRK